MTQEHTSVLVVSTRAPNEIAVFEIFSLLPLKGVQSTIKDPIMRMSTYRTAGAWKVTFRASET